MADDVTYTAGANATPPDTTKAATDETTAGPHSAGSHMGIAKLAVSADGDSTHVPATVADGLLVQVSNAAVPVSGTVAVTLPDEGQQTMANSISVAVASNQSDLPTKEKRAATATTSQVADNAANQTLLAANANRLGATIQNDSSAALYVKLGTTATTSDYTVRLTQYAYYEVPFNYTGRIDGIWASDPNDGAARVTELTA